MLSGGGENLVTGEGLAPAVTVPRMLGGATAT